MASSSQVIDVPADDLCFYHCLSACIRGSTTNFSREDAMSVRADICRILGDMGFPQEAAHLTEAGFAGYPEEYAFVAGATLIAGRLEVLTMEQVFSCIWARAVQASHL